MNNLQTIFEDITDSAAAEYFDENRTPAGVKQYAEGARCIYLTDAEAALISRVIDRYQLDDDGLYSLTHDRCLEDLETGTETEAA